MRARYTETARDEAEDILAHIARNNSAAAAEIAATIEATVARLLVFLRLGSETDVRGVHIMIARPYPYLIFFSIEGDELVIRNLRHPARRRPPSNRS